MKNNGFKEGDFVVYKPKFENELGRIKSFCNNLNYAFVVYNCARDWDNYMNYTGARTSLEDLTLYNNNKPE